MPPGSAKASSRAAILTPSPKMSSPLTMTSPILMPILNSILRSSGSPALRALSAPWISMAHSTDSNELTNSASTLSPAVPTTFPWCISIRLNMTSR